MIKNTNVKKEDFDYKPLNKKDGMPWPRIPKDPEEIPDDIPLKEEYLLRTMDFLDTPEARPMFEKQADIIIENNIKGIVDVGCRIGIVNEILYDRGYHDYNYMGFDTSPQPIEYASQLWQYSPNIEYRCKSMDDYDDIKVDFDADCVIWSGILLYRPDDHMRLFHDITVDLYQAKHAIIQEPCKDQDHDKYPHGMQLHTIDNELYRYKEKYSDYVEWKFDLNMFLGKRKVCHIII
jgi:SAM-dependent methyltransferase